jgi:hypothetical protein
MGGRRGVGGGARWNAVKQNGFEGSHNVVLKFAFAKDACWFRFYPCSFSALKLKASNCLFEYHVIGFDPA